MEAVHSIDPQDEQHLDQLVIGHYIVGGITCLFGCLPLLHVTIGLFVVTASGHGGATPPALFGWFFVAMGAMAFLLAQSLGIALIVSGRQMRRRINHTFSFIVACVACMFMPFGTILGVFTIIVLSRASVKSLYGQLA